MEVRPDSSSARKLGYGIVDGGSEDLNPLISRGNQNPG